MVRAVQNVAAAIRHMPGGLRFVTLISAAVSLGVLSIFQLLTWRGRQDEFSLWPVGFGVTFAFITYGLVRARPWARAFFVVAFNALLLSSAEVSEAFVWSSVSVLYLFLSRRVETYFTCQEQPLEPAERRRFFWRPRRRLFPDEKSTPD